MFNSEQQDYMKELSAIKPENLCYCGWYRKGECHSCPPELSAADKLKTKCETCGSTADYNGNHTHRVNCTKKY